MRSDGPMLPFLSNNKDTRVLFLCFCFRDPFQLSHLICSWARASRGNEASLGAVQLPLSCRLPTVRSDSRRDLQPFQEFFYRLPSHTSATTTIYYRQLSLLPTCLLSRRPWADVLVLGLCSDPLTRFPRRHLGRVSIILPLAVGSEAYP